MRNKEVARSGNLRIVIVDSITKLGGDDTGAVVVSGSHGGTSAAEFALAARPAIGCGMRWVGS